jgi:hypothetical protein
LFVDTEREREREREREKEMEMEKSERERERATTRSSLDGSRQAEEGRLFSATGGFG